MSEPENFADYPLSLSEVVSDRDGDASKWTPRDVLISLLRDIDRGEVTMDVLAVVWSRPVGDAEREYGYRVSLGSKHEAQGLISRLWFKVMTDEL